MITCSRITKRYNGRLVLNEIDFAICPGTITALMGPTGAGKTTLLKVASLLEAPDEGSVSIEGSSYIFPMEEDPKPNPWPTVSVVFQDLVLWPHLTNRENILLASKIRFGSKADVALEKWAARLGLYSLLGRYPNQVSRGERQLVAVARALVLAPKYLLLDEISASLDVERAVAIAGLLRELANEGTGILLVTHQLGFTRHAADRLLYLDGGRFVEDGDVTLLESPRSEKFRAYLELVARAV